MKQCRVCEQVLPIDAFQLRKEARVKGCDVRRSECRRCRRVYIKRWVKGNVEARYWVRLRSNLMRYGPTPHKSELLKLESPTCYLCGCGIDRSNRELDHVTPRSSGGANDISNLRWACRPCNRMKHDLPLDAFLERLDLIRSHFSRCA